MVSHETKRTLGTTGLLFIVALVVAGGLPFSGSRIATVAPRTLNRLPPALVFHANLSVTFVQQSFNLSLTGNHVYMWRFNVTHGSIEASLAIPRAGVSFWNVGPGSPGQFRLNGPGVASFNWTAPTTGYYSLTLEGEIQSQWLSPILLSVCDVHVWDLNPTLTVRFTFE